MSSMVEEAYDRQGSTTRAHTDNLTGDDQVRGGGKGGGKGSFEGSLCACVHSRLGRLLDRPCLRTCTPLPYLVLASRMRVAHISSFSTMITHSLHDRGGPGGKGVHRGQGWRHAEYTQRE